MNARIQLLAEQCGFRSNPDIYDRNQSFDIGKFAELIVRECIEWCDAHATINGTAQQVRDSIKQHFGVRE